MKARWQQVVAFARREPQTAMIFALVAIASLVPVWIGRYLPLLDGPNHLAITFVWRHLSDPEWGFDKVYTSNLAPLPYWAQYAIEYVLSIPFGIEIAQKLFLSASILALPISIALYARRMGRDPRLALFAFPLAWNVNLANGFLSYVAGLPVLFFALIALDKYAERPTLKWGAIAALTGTSLYFFHFLSWGMFLAIGGFSSLPAPRPWSVKRALLAPLPTLPTALVGLVCYKIGNSASVNLPVNTGRGLAGFQGAYNDLQGNLTMFPTWIMDFSPGDRDALCALALCFAWLLLLCARPFTAGTPEPASALPERDVRAWRLELAALVCFLLYLALPRSLLQPFYWFAVNRRLAVAVALFAALLVRGPIAGPRRWLLAVAAIVAVLYPLDIARHFYRFNKKAHGYDEVIAEVPKGKLVLPLMMTLGDPEEVNVNCYNNWGAYVQMREGGYMVQYFSVEFPIKYKTSYRHPAPAWDRPDLFNYAAHGAPWDYFLIHGPSKVDPFAKVHDKVKLLKKSGDWEIWQNLGKR
jgi:hypothetical protein